MLAVEFPEPDFRFQGEKGQEMIWDSIRRKWVRLTPEEWVRQNFVRFLTGVKGYPPSLIAIEKQIRLGELSKRYDIAVYYNTEPWLVIECKEPEVPIDQKVLEQILRYNTKLTAQFLILTNGHQHFGWQLENTGFRWLEALPDWPGIV
jgi:hypothetical protein